LLERDLRRTGPFPAGEWLKCLPYLEIKSLGMLAQSVIQSKVQFFFLVKCDSHASPIRVLNFLKINVFELRTYIPDAGKAYHANTSDDGYAIFRLQDTLVLIPEPAGIIPSHAVGSAQGSQAAKRNFSCGEHSVGLQGQDLFFIDPEEAPDVNDIASILIIRPHKGQEVIEPKLHHCALAWRKGVVSGVKCKAETQAEDMIAIPADDVLLVKKSVLLVLYIEDPLMFKYNP